MAGSPDADDEADLLRVPRQHGSRGDRKSGNLKWKTGLSSRPAGGPLRWKDFLLMPLVSNQIVGFDPDSGKPNATPRPPARSDSNPTFVATFV
jgi:hypothetical protein